MVSNWEILESLRRYDKLTTSEMATILGATSTNDLQQQLRLLEAKNLIARTGILREGKRKRKSVEWKLTEACKNMLKKHNCREFYELEPAKKQEEKLIKKRGKGFKRFY
jgi:DNA-binding HxlR family transcriptional regulator